jgi:hypothetical protein
VESGEERQKIQARMKRMAAMGALGMGTTGNGAGLRDVGLAVSSVKSEFGRNRVDVKSIARKADLVHKNVPRETARYLRDSSGEWSPSSMNRKSVFEESSRERPGRSTSISSMGSQSSAGRETRAASTAAAAAKSSSFNSADDNSSSPSAKGLPSSPKHVNSENASSSTGFNHTESKEQTSDEKSHLPSPPNIKTPISPTRAFAMKTFGHNNSDDSKSATFAGKKKGDEQKHHGAGPTAWSAAHQTKARHEVPVEQKVAHEVEEVDTDPNRKYSLDELQKGIATGINVSKKEDYMKVSEFKRIFGITPEAYSKYPEWKKIELRKQHKIF